MTGILAMTAGDWYMIGAFAFVALISALNDRR